MNTIVEALVMVRLPTLTVIPIDVLLQHHLRLVDYINGYTKCNMSSTPPH